MDFIIQYFVFSSSNVLVPSPVNGEGAGWGPDLQIQNHVVICKIHIAEQNLSRNEASPAPFRGGGTRGRVPIEGARKFKLKQNNPYFQQ